MRKTLFTLLILLLPYTNLSAENDVKRIYEGKDDSKITILVYESLTCSHCAKFHSEVYPNLKINFNKNTDLLQGVGRHLINVNKSCGNII